MGPMSMFPSFPHSITFEESRELKIIATPVDDSAEIYTITHNRQEYGVMKTEDATISATIQLVAAADGVDLGADQVVVPISYPLRFGWKTKEVYVNGDLINPTSTHESDLEYVNYLLTQTPTGYKDNRVNLHDAGGGLVNSGGHKRWLAYSQSGEVICGDHLDILGHNKRYVPSSYDMKIVLHRLEKTKFLFGTTQHCTDAKVLIKNLKLTIPMMKPVQQLSDAINDIMIQKAEECKFYVTHYRFAAKPLAIGAQYVQFSDIFDGTQPTRMICYQKSQTRYNGHHQHNHNRLISIILWSKSTRLMSYRPSAMPKSRI
ncbi:Hypothetical predicted protein [Paramuricea clavata]|uniref:Uncharacterized protein n=1 Tax=Paramuricea clavata TaxID=317549 RepID=A0A7D9JRX8_PARCT|nr:Hypothetical predicted protein [Paramuricea clavata]